MSGERAYRLTAAAAQRRGLPRLALELVAPSGVEVVPAADGAQLVRCVVRRPDGGVIGELAIDAFKAAMIIDRDGVLADKARALVAADPRTELTAVAPVTLATADGFRATAHVRGIERPLLPYLSVLAIASTDLATAAGLAIVMWSARPEWHAAEEILRSLRLGR